VADPFDDSIRSIKDLAGVRILVGIPEENQSRVGEPISNALLGYIHEFGSPAANIPPRAFLIPGVQAAVNGTALPGKMRSAARAALAGDKQLMRRRMAEAGILAVRSVTRGIQMGIPPPLAPATVARRRRRTPGSKYRRKALKPGDVTPLIDTGDLLHAITWVWDKVK